MYETYWGLQEKPFENTPDPRFLYHSQKHEEALTRLLYVIRERKGAGLLTGDYGSGKTLLTRVLLQEVQKAHYVPAVIFNPRLSPLALLKEIVFQLAGHDARIPSRKNDLLHYLNQILITNHQNDKRTILIVDEAQAITDDAIFEELRLLLNYQLPDGFLLTFIMVGQPELKAKVNRLPQLRQRIAVRYHLQALNEQETIDYIQHRLRIAGAQKEIFTADALAAVFYFSTGIPRRINNIADMALLVGCGETRTVIDRPLIQEVSGDLDETPIVDNTLFERVFYGQPV